MVYRESRVTRQMDWRLDVLLAATLAVLCTLLHLGRGGPWALVLDLSACAAAALTVRLPRVAGVGLALILTSLLFVPAGWWSMAEYAPWIPILGTGLRTQRRSRLWMTVGYATVLGALTIQDVARGGSVASLAFLLWLLLAGFLWMVGDSFSAYRRTQQRAHVDEILRQRETLARELHDTVARDLSRASLQAQSLMEERGLPELEAVIAGIRQASTQLRWMLTLLREPSSARTPLVLGRRLAEAIGEGERGLLARGFAVTITVEGELDHVPQALEETLCSAMDEACANIELHGDPSEPCGIVVSVGDGVIDALFLNRVADDETLTSSAKGVGLVGLKERLGLVGGELVAEREGSQWVTRISLPI